MRVIDRLGEFEYILEDERDIPKDERTIWILKGLSYSTQQNLEGRVQPVVKVPGAAIGGGKEVFQRAILDAEVTLNIGGGERELQFDILSEGLVDVRNLMGPEGVVEYPGPNAPVSRKKDFFGRWIPSQVRIELSNAITSGSTLSEDESKN